jgi:hypothetical protein
MRRSQPEWGMTAAIGVNAPLSKGGPGVALWLGVRRWIGPHFIVSCAASYQHFGINTTDGFAANVDALAAVGRLEIAGESAGESDGLQFPGFSLYVGAGPELLATSLAGPGLGVRAVFGLHLPRLIQHGVILNGPGDLWPLLFLLPTAVELQFRTGGAGVPPSSAVVFALAL